jgi:indolepyruvate ferredoxin oxidoreductase alpha subunit
VLDPSSPEEAYAMTKYAFELSEKLSRPVNLRPTTKVCHASATVEIDDKPDTLKTPEGFIKDPKWVIFPPLSFKKHSENFKVYNEMQDEDCAYNSVQSVPDSKYGIATGGVTSAIVADVLADMNVIVNRLIVGRPYPFPVSAAKKFAATSEKILVLEELEPFIEDNLARHTGYGSIIGKYTKDVPAAGELKYENVRIIIERFLGIETAAQSPTSGGHAASGLASGGGNSGGNSGGNLSGDDFSELQLPVRAPVLCAGCPHRASFYAVKLAAAERLKNSANALSDEAVYCGDIGCYTLGNAKPLSVTDTCLCMGAGITLAQGIAAMNPARDVFAFIGDSTFFASGMTGVANAVYNKHNITIIILDNRTTAMTGGQPHPGTGRTMMNETSTPIDIAGVLRALGVPHIAEADPLDLKIAIETVKTAADFKGVSAVVFKSPCIAVAKKTCTYEVNDCIGCKRCINEIGCPAISLKENKAVIDPVMCFGCGICEFVCKPGKIRKAEDNI